MGLLRHSGLLIPLFFVSHSALGYTLQYNFNNDPGFSATQCERAIEDYYSGEKFTRTWLEDPRYKGRVRAKTEYLQTRQAGPDFSFLTQDGQAYHVGGCHIVKGSAKCDFVNSGKDGYWACTVKSRNCRPVSSDIQLQPTCPKGWEFLRSPPAPAANAFSKNKSQSSSCGAGPWGEVSVCRVQSGRKLFPIIKGNLRVRCGNKRTAAYCEALFKSFYGGSGRHCTHTSSLGQSTVPGCDLQDLAAGSCTQDPVSRDWECQAVSNNCMDAHSSAVPVPRHYLRSNGSDSCPEGFRLIQVKCQDQASGAFCQWLGPVGPTPLRLITPSQRGSGPKPLKAIPATP